MRNTQIAVCAALIGLMSCSSQKQFVADPPFGISEARVQDWAAGREEGGSGTKLSMRWNPFNPGQIALDTLYFRNRALIPEVVDTETGMRLTASYPRVPQEKPDMVMSSDSLQEVGNQPPMPLPEAAGAPFDLARDEAVLTYTRTSDGKRFYYKIVGIRELPPRNAPGRPRN